MAICEVCRIRHAGNNEHSRGWLIIDRSKHIYDSAKGNYYSPEYRVCGTCERVMGDVNMRLAGYQRKGYRGVWSR